MLLEIGEYTTQSQKPNNLSWSVVLVVGLYKLMTQKMDYTWVLHFDDPVPINVLYLGLAFWMTQFYPLAYTSFTSIPCIPLSV